MLTWGAAFLLYRADLGAVLINRICMWGVDEVRTCEFYRKEVLNVFDFKSVQSMIEIFVSF